MKTIFYNGTVYTGNDFQEAFIIEENKFTHIGTSKEILAYANENDKIIDLNNKFVCAGFNDSHMHLLNYGKALRSAKLYAHTSSIQEIITCMKKFIEDNEIQKGFWVIGRGWNHDYFDEIKMPTRVDLDKISTDHPICITRACGHCLVVNTYVLNILNIDPDTYENKDIAQGIFYDDTMYQVSKAMGKPSIEELKTMMENASKILNSYGVTSVQSDDYGAYKNVSFEEVNQAYRELIEEDKLSVRIYEQANLKNIQLYQEFIDKGYKTNTGDIYFKFGPMKLVADGS